MERVRRSMQLAGLAAALCLAGAVTGPAQEVDFPGVASAGGANGTVWRSQAVLYNPGDGQVTVTLALVPRSQADVTARVVYDLGAGETVAIEDVYQALGAPDGAGTLQVSGGALAWIRTFNQGVGGTFGQGIPAVLRSTGLAGQSVYFPVATAHDLATEPRSNLVLENLEDETTTVLVRCGGLERSWSIPPRTTIQINRIGTELGAGAGTSVISVTGDGRWAGYVSTVDPLSGDPTTVGGLGAPGGGTVLFPGVAHAAGANGTQWRSRLVLHNPGAGPTQVHLALVPRGSPDPVARLGLELQAGETRDLDDLYGELRAPDGVGTLSVSGPVLAWVRTYNLLADGATYGQGIPPVGDDTVLTPGEELLFPISNPEDVATGFRSNLVVENPATDVAATCTLRAGDATAGLAVPAGTYVQVDRVAESLSPTPGPGTLTLHLSCDEPVAAFVATIDPVTGDPTTVLGLRRDELSLAPPRITAQPAGGTVPAGTLHELSVGVEGAGPLSFQWFRGASGDLSDPVAGAVSDHVTVGPLESSESFWVQVENPGGVVASAAATLTVAAGTTAVPVLDPPPGTYQAPVEVHLSCATPGARIHYTTDGSTPTMDSPVYRGEALVAAHHVTGANDPDPEDEYLPLTTVTLEVRAFAEADGLQSSPEVAGDYVIDTVDTAFYVPYGPPPTAGGTKHTLDIYQPHGRTGTPVLFFVHGGAWKQGDKDIYAELGNTFAGYYGFTTVVINYELSTDPWNAVFPEHIEDVADAFAWTWRHIAEYGGDPQRIWLFGQSAGGHLVSLLATDGSYLAARGLSTSLIRGVVSMSGAYDLYDMVQYPMNPLGLDPDEILEYKALMLLVFGSYDQGVLDPYSPSTHVNAGQPPFRVIWAWDDMPGFPEEGQRFYDQVSALQGSAIDRFLLLESDIPQPVLDLALGGHYEEIYAINTRDWDSVSTRAVASFVDPTVPFPEIGR